jgi:uncharacterized protein (TIGR02118 family)
MSVVVTISYPAAPDAVFDLEYYTNSHLPFVESKYKPHGLKSWYVTKFGEGQPYTYQFTMFFETMEGYAAASAQSREAVVADIAKFSNKTPVRTVSQIFHKG